VALNSSMYGLDGKPQSIKNNLTYCLRWLGVDHLNLYQPTRIDLGIHVEETIEAILEMVRLKESFPDKTLSF
jgi:aryl-alcohol dehydrogenase-like predicted oxidoreductase